MKKIGITGGIGSGKSIVSEIFHVLGIPLYNADQRAKLLMQSDEGVIEKIKNLFGEESYTSGSLNRSYIAQKVFNDKDALNRLNGIVHPAVAKDFENFALQFKEGYVLKEAALLFESESYKQLDQTILVTAPASIRMGRVLERDDFRSEEEVLRIMDNQWQDEDKLALADFVVNNDGAHALIPQVMEIHRKLQKL